MLSKEAVVAQIHRVLAEAVSLGLSNEQIFPSVRQIPDGCWLVTVPKNADLGVALKDISYKEIYISLEESRAFNMKLVDGALIQMCYTFDASGLAAHRLGFFPSPDLEQFQNSPELYEDDELYADILAKGVVPFPIRFDYKRETDSSSDVWHPSSHLTLGQYQNCRIPVSAPLTPFVFSSFLFRSFYNTAFGYLDESRFKGEHFDDCIATRDLSIPHLRLRDLRQSTTH